MKPTTHSPPFELEAALRGTEGDAELLAELTDILRQQLPASRAGLRQAVAQHDLAALRQQTHQLAGALGLYHAAPSLALIRQLQTSALSADWARLDLLLTELDGELDRLLAALAGL